MVFHSAFSLRNTLPRIENISFQVTFRNKKKKNDQLLDAAL